MPGGVRMAVVGGVVCACALLLSPASSPGADAVLPAVLPLGFFAAGAVSESLRPGHRVGRALLAVGVLHLAALAAAVGATSVPWSAAATGTAAVSAALFAVGFVALFDLLVRYPTGRYAWPALAPVVRGLAVLALVLTAVSVLGSRSVPAVLGGEGPANPLHVPALAGLADAFSVVAVLPVVGLVLLAVRYSGAPADDRAQMRWPMVTTAVVVAGLLTTAWAERVLGPAAQAAVFVTAGAVLPASFLVGLLRHTEDAERLAAVEASRARLAHATDVERRRIERNLHDGAQQHVLALLAQVELTRAELGGRDDRADRGLRSIADGLRSVHGELRELAQGLYPAVLADRGLAEAVRSAMGRLPGKVSLRVQPAVDGRRYAEPVEGAAYFLVLEGLANVLKHSGAAATEVSLAEVADRLEVVVRDDGTGFDASSVGAGLLGLSDRLAAAGGRLVVDSRPAGGTVLRGILPAGARG